MNIHSVIQTFDFDEKWIDSGFLKEEMCNQLLESWNAATDKHTEHYRYAVYRSILDLEELTFADFVTYIELCETEFGTALYCSPFIDLVKWDGLTLAQVNHLLSRYEEFPAPVRNAIDKHLSK